MNEHLKQDFIQSISERGYWLSKELVPDVVVENLFHAAQTQFNNLQFHQAQIGKGSQKQEVPSIRKDRIFWIDDWASEPYLSYGKILKNLIEVFREDFFLPLKKFEGHFAHYDLGDFYVRHVDRHKVEPHRFISTVLYLNSIPSDQGGQLVLHLEGGNVVKIPPIQAQIVVFKSEIPHEVLRAEAPRWSLTSWLRDDL